MLKVLDLGSGKGYLSEYLALHFGYTVVGVDSQQVNTDGAWKRNAKVAGYIICISHLCLREAWIQAYHSC